MIGNNLSYSAESKLIKNQKLKFIILDISDLLDRAPENQGFHLATFQSTFVFPKLRLLDFTYFSNPSCYSHSLLFGT